jgi:hypothetical protein
LPLSSFHHQFLESMARIPEILMRRFLATVRGAPKCRIYRG